MTTAVESAPSTPAPAAPASGGDQPSWAADGGVNSFLSGATSDRPAAAPAPSTRMEPKPVESTQPAPAEPASAAAPAPIEAPKPETVAPANPAVTPAAAAPTPERLFAGRFKTDVELEKAYEASGLEARRLLKASVDSQEMVKAANAEIAKRDAEIEAFKLEKQLGPEIAEPTPEEAANWTAKQFADHAVSKLKRDQLKEKLENQAKTSAAAVKASTEERTKQVFDRMEFMSKNTEEFPGFDDYMKTGEDGKGPIANWMPLLPMLAGHPVAPLALYLIARGHESLQKDKASNAATLKSKNDAAALLNASLPAAAGPGAGATPAPEPARTTAPQDDSDAGHNERLIASHAWSRPVLPYD